MTKLECVLKNRVWIFMIDEFMVGLKVGKYLKPLRIKSK
ncbi:hypothetical protein MNV_390001 [Candidatus Methanoperedens nitroreducens]|uniref:Uncharacterized protein n=1 Tax=Candidatus Methanoperedens nitratireducens TaxID=1392998 RepID=A0A284VQH0_9EURY|nr:hypothetical protein MNV_390001 [Candidatus Methanoperedens nitroreducens]